MATKRKRKRAKRRANPTKKRATHRRKRRRANPANPRRRRSHARRIHHRASKRRTRRAHARRANPTHRRRTHRRRTHRRNPGGPLAQAAIGLALAAGAFVLTDVVTFYATSDMAKDGERNRKILGGLAIAGGLYLAQKHPLMGLGIAAGGALSGFGNMIMLQVLKLLPPKQNGQTALKGIGAVAYDNMSAVAYDNLAALQLEAGRPMGAVAYDNLAGWESMGDPIPPAPWESDSPFGDNGAYPT